VDFLDQFYSEDDQNHLIISAQQGSSFAKDIADDFNPIHNSDSKRFCVPGDLLFGIALQKYGLHEEMVFEFQDLVKADTSLLFPAVQENSDAGQIQVTNEREKPVITLEYSGASSHDAVKTESLLRNYVAFSGHNFPHILVPLMKQHGVMINPARPLVIYQSMSLRFNHLNFNSLNIELQNTSLNVNGKRGDAHLKFSMLSDGDVVGSGHKKLVLSGLRNYEEEAVAQMSAAYASLKNS